MEEMRTRAEFYRDRAIEMRAAAEMFRRKETYSTLMRVADGYERMAANLEAIAESKAALSGQI